jgi:hypothetical protein
MCQTSYGCADTFAGEQTHGYYLKYILPPAFPFLWR